MSELLAAQRVHLIGIGGSGMSALASLLLEMGKTVSGSEVAPGPATDALRAGGAQITVGHAPHSIRDAEYVIRSAAIADDNVEVVEALRRDLPMKKLAEAVGELMSDRSGVAIAGTHGKTTTTSLVAWLLEQGGLDPLVLIGADTPAFPQGAHLGAGPMVVEADEYDRRFLSYWPEVAVVTSIEADHLDYYRDLAEIRSAFEELVQRLPLHGRLVVCADEPCAAALESPARRETYGFAESADWRIEDYAPTAAGGASFTLHTDGRVWPVRSPLVGEHNARNVTAAIAVADHFGIGLRASLAALPTFEGAKRRFETKGRPRGIWVVDDYGHHPTEAQAVLRAAASAAAGAVWVVFQPHTTNRTAALFDDFARSFTDADHALILPIYRPRGREVAARPVTAEDLVGAVRAKGHPDARFVASFDAALDAVVAEAQPGDLVITMGAGDVTQLADRLVAALA
ncbi:MAG TPA: UDP-N-acetylmuramate--L-alanine ligase [Chloroflexota bacterium]|nr:UDP-N-acetylmuramate--L-alanine ligase [Chloroflexota bacterium]